MGGRLRQHHPTSSGVCSISSCSSVYICLGGTRWRRGEHGGSISAPQRSRKKPAVVAAHPAPTSSPPAPPPLLHQPLALSAHLWSEHLVGARVRLPEEGPGGVEGGVVVHAVQQVVGMLRRDRRIFVPARRRPGRSSGAGRAVCMPKAQRLAADGRRRGWDGGQQAHLKRTARDRGTDRMVSPSAMSLVAITPRRQVGHSCPIWKPFCGQGCDRWRLGGGSGDTPTWAILPLPPRPAPSRASACLHNGRTTALTGLPCVPARCRG